MKKTSVFVSALFVVASVLFTLTFSIGLPIYVRPFYYLQIDSLELESRSGATKEQIKEAYDGLLDYLTLPEREFTTGVFKHTQSGRSHFEDCKVLFSLNSTVLLISALVMVLCKISDKTGLVKFARRDLFLISGASTLSLCTVLCVIVSLDFEKAFTVFHKLFFYGKENWYFDPKTDGIIEILPERFFVNCAVFIGASIVLLSTAFIVYGARKRRASTK